MRTHALLALLCLFAAGAAAADPTLVRVHGRVEIGRGTPPVWREARGGEPLAPGDSVRTAAGAKAELALGDQRVVRVYEESVLRIGTEVTPTGAIGSVELDEGQSLFDVLKKTVADEFEVTTPEIVVSVKGTRFLVAAVPGDDWTAVFRGEVALAGDGFEAISVRPGRLGARGELFVAPFGDPWSAWESGAPAPDPALDERREREKDAAVQAAVSSPPGGARANEGALGQIVASLLGGERHEDATATAGDADATLVAGATGAASDLLAPVTDTAAPLVEPVLDPVTGVLDPVLEPVVNEVLPPVNELLDGLL